jgi:murein DD-endopeptidase MepM/ murein hydrolase activator NlpD
MKPWISCAALPALLLSTPSTAWAGLICVDTIVETPGASRKEKHCTRDPDHRGGRAFPPDFRPATRDPAAGGGGGAPTVPTPAPGNPFDNDKDGKLDCWKDAVGPASAGARGSGSKTRISSPYGPSKWRPGGWHYGVDLVSRTGNFGLGQPVRAISDGVVLQAGTTEKNGNFVAIKHPDGRVSKYIHLKTFLAKKDAEIRAGDMIGTMNCTGLCGQGARLNHVKSTHVHIELLASLQAGRNREERLDPIALMRNCK